MSAIHNENNAHQTNEYDVDELLGQIIDAFDDFLERRNLRIPTSDAEMDEAGESTEENAARIFGTDYDELKTEIEGTLRNWKLI